jgi:simple sugar transport system ATP-binding protein
MSALLGQGPMYLVDGGTVHRAFLHIDDATAAFQTILDRSDDTRNQIYNVAERLADLGITVRDPEQPVGTMSGGERQCLAIARAIHFGARVLILDEPTAALGVKQSANVLRIIARARDKGLSVIFITHNVHHAYPVGDTFTLLDRGRSMGTFAKRDISRDEVLNMMAGGQEMADLMAELGVRL